MPIEPSFASDTTATRTTITQAMMDAGFQTGQTLTAGQLNSYLRYALSSNPSFAEIDTAYNDIDAGCVAQVYENDTALRPGDFIDSYQSSATAWNVIAATSTGIVVANSAGTALYFYPRSNVGGSSTVTYTLTNAGTIRAVTIYQNIVAAVYGNYVEWWNLTTGTSLFSYNHGGALHDVQINGNYVICCGASGTGSFEARVLNRTTGALADSLSASTATLYSCAIYGSNVFFGGTVAAGANISAYLLSGSTLTVNPRWPAAVTIGTTIQSIRTDGRNLYLLYIDPTDVDISCVSMSDGSVLHTFATGLVTSASNALVVDQGGVYVAIYDGIGADSYLYRLAPVTLSSVWTATLPPTTIAGVATDGCRIWAINSVAGTVDRVWTYARGNVPQRFTKVDTSTLAYLRFPWLMQPAVE